MWIDPLGLRKICPDEALKEIEAKMKGNGKSISVHVGSQADAEEVLRGYMTSKRARSQGRFRNTTNQKLPDGKKSKSGSQWLPDGKEAFEKKGTYHYDKADINAKPGDHALIGNHIQIHTYEGKIIRIFYD